jgi:hypothetical protein
MFHFPAFPPTPYEFGMQVTRHDSRQVTPFGHPGITARLTAPPGLSQPPTSFIGPWYQGIHRPPLPTYPTHKTSHTTDEPQNTKKQKCSRPLCKSQPTTNPQPHHPPHSKQHSHAWHQDNNPTAEHSTHGCSLRTSTGCPPPSRPAPPPLSPPPTGVPPDDGRTRRGRHQPAELASVSAHEHPGGPVRAEPGSLPTPHPGDRETLLRKEVIQPHLPVRLPCYDFVPIASPTFDGSPPHGLGHRLRVLPTFVT